MTNRRACSSRPLLRRRNLSTRETQSKSSIVSWKHNVIELIPLGPRKTVDKADDHLPPVKPQIMTHAVRPSRKYTSEASNRSNESFILPTTQDLLPCKPIFHLPARTTIRKHLAVSVPYYVEQVHSTHPYVPGVCGLKNLGNTCFMNSALQCLSNVPDLTDEAMRQCSILPQDTNNILYTYASLIQKMWSGDNNLADPKDIKHLVGRSFPIFADYSQKDAHEFMNSLLNMMEETGWAHQIHQLFHIQIKSKVTCNVNRCVDSIDESNNFLPLPLSKETMGQTEISLVKLIEEFTTEEPLQGLYYCQHCDNHVSAKQQTTITALPRVLIIQLKRFPFDGTTTKINTSVRYELEYDHLLSENDGYSLCAVSVHIGRTLGFGHYITFAKNATTQQWYEFNDAHCKKVTVRDVITKDAYILVYVRSAIA